MNTPAGHASELSRQKGLNLSNRQFEVLIEMITANPDELRRLWSTEPKAILEELKEKLRSTRPPASSSVPDVKIPGG